MSDVGCPLVRPGLSLPKLQAHLKASTINDTETGVQTYLTIYNGSKARRLVPGHLIDD